MKITILLKRPIFINELKRIASILLFFLYLIPSIGIEVSAHYCGGELAKIIVIPSDEHPCPCNPKDMKDNCCSDKNFQFKLDVEHQKTINDVQFLNQVAALIQPVFLIQKTTVLAAQPALTSYGLNNPDPPNLRRYIRFQSFLI